MIKRGAGRKCPAGSSGKTKTVLHSRGMRHRLAGKGMGSLGGGAGEFRRAAAAGRGSTEALGEFLDASGGIDEFLLAREERMGGGGDTERHNIMFHTINYFRLLGGGGGPGDEAGTAGGVHKDDVV